MSLHKYNPNHPMTAFATEHMTQIIAIYMHAHGLKELVITEKDIVAFPRGAGIAMRASDATNTITLTFVTEAEALALAKEEGGLAH